MILQVIGKFDTYGEGAVYVECHKVEFLLFPRTGITDIISIQVFIITGGDHHRYVGF